MENTLKNLTMAFIGESMARNRYTFFSKVAKKEGYQQIAEIFLLTSDNEREHAETLWDLLNDLNSGNLNQLKIELDTPIIGGDTIANLQSAIAGEAHEYSEMYPEFARIAEEEGYADVSARLMAIAIAEKHHHERYEKILEQLKKAAIFKKEKETHWVCRECGYAHSGFEPPEKCPSCHHDRSYFQVKCEEY